MAKILSPDRLSGSKDIAENSLAAVYGLPVEVVDGFVIQTVVATGRVEALSVGDKTFDANNETVKKAELEYVRLKDETEVQFEVTNGSLVAASVGVLFDLSITGTVDFGAVAPSQLTCRKFISATQGVFVRAK